MSCTVVKLGGRAAAVEERIAALAAELGANSSGETVLVHGGGAEVTEVSARFDLTARFVGGVRMTTPEEMRVVDMVLRGRVNVDLVRRIGPRAVGVSLADAGMARALPVGDVEQNRTARAGHIDPQLLKVLLDTGYLPVVAPVATGEDGRGVNINADEAALALAEALGADRLLFLSDTPGILQEDELVPVVDSARAEELIANGVIQGGMTAKVRAALEAVRRGVGEVIIGEYCVRGDLTRMCAGEGCTRIVAEADNASAGRHTE